MRLGHETFLGYNLAVIETAIVNLFNRNVTEKRGSGGTPRGLLGKPPS